MTRSELIALVPNKPYRMPCCRECIGKSKKDCDENPLNCIDFYLFNKETIDKLSLKASKDGEDNARYIDVEKVHIPKGFFKDLNVPKLLDWLKSQPTADAVEVVRCKNCKYSRKIGEFRRCEHSNDTTPITPIEDMHYCSYGERKCDE